MDTQEMLRNVVKQGASDIYIIAGLPLTFKINGTMHTLDDNRLMPEDTASIVTSIYTLAENRNITKFRNTGDDDFSFSIKGLSRFRVSTYKQRGSYSAVIRVITFTLPSPKEIGIPDTVMNLCQTHAGLVLVTGPAGGGKSTTLACMIDKINREETSHIITLEDPLEFLHRHDKSIVSQREVSTDTESYITALRASLRQSPDVILLGEMRDFETMNVAMMAAETGHLIFSTLHTIGAANTIDRIIDAFPATQQHQIRIQLSMVLKAVVSQQLLPTSDGELVPVFEIMMVTPAIRNLIREGKVHQIDDRISTSSSEHMVTMDSSILALYHTGRITKKVALEAASNPELLEKKIGQSF